MTLLHRTSTGRRTGRAPRPGRWTAGFGPVEDPYRANVTAVGHRAARRRLARCLALHRDLLARDPATRQAFADASDALAATGPGVPFRCELVIGGEPLVFWLLPAVDAARWESRPKR
jgi:hypothetical protein